MKLISAEVDNFGKLEGFHHTFMDNMDVITAANGFGKTTFCAFIFAMFYGFNDRFTLKYRERYAPWQGGVYGGTITFSAQGKNYILKRTFGYKNPKEDTFYLVDAGEGSESHDFDEYIGEQLFGLSAESFASTVFIGSAGPIFTATDNISVKINSTTMTDEEKTSFDLGIEGLEKYLEDNNVNNKTGRVSELIAELDDMRNGIDKNEITRNSLSEREEKLNKQKTELEKIKAEFDELNLKLLNNARAKEGRLVLEKKRNIEQRLKEAESDLNNQDKASYIGGILFILLGVLMMLLGVCAYLFAIHISVTLGCQILGLVFLIIGNIKNVKNKRKYLRVRARLEGKLKECQKTYDEFLKNNSLEYAEESVKSEGAEIKLQDITSLQSLLVARRSELEEEIRNNEFKKTQETESLKGAKPLDQAIKERETEIASELHEIELHEQALEFLKEARASYLRQYLKPINKSFKKYYKLFTGMDADKFSIDSDLRLIIRDHDMDRTEDMYSAGFRDIFGLCMRLSMLDSLFKKEMPFMMMDDPFVNLDSVKKEKAVITMQRLPYQIIITQKY